MLITVSVILLIALIVLAVVTVLCCKQRQQYALTKSEYEKIKQVTLQRPLSAERSLPPIKVHEATYDETYEIPMTELTEFSRGSTLESVNSVATTERKQSTCSYSYTESRNDSVKTGQVPDLMASYYIDLHTAESGLD